MIRHNISTIIIIIIITVRIKFWRGMEKWTELYAVCSTESTTAVVVESPVGTTATFKSNTCPQAVYKIFCFGVFSWPISDHYDSYNNKNNNIDVIKYILYSLSYYNVIT